MSVLEGNVTNLIQGVSQQDPKIRAIGQHTEQTNCRSNITLGLTKRPGSKFEWAVPAEIPVTEDTVIHTYKSGEEEYVLFLNPDGMAVTDAAGALQPLKGPENESYVEDYIDPLLTETQNYSDYVGQGNSALAGFTIGDTTFVLNKDVPVSQLTEIYTGSDFHFIYVKKVTFGLTYRVTAPGQDVMSENTFTDVAAGTTTFTVNFPGGAVASNTWQVRINTIYNPFITVTVLSPTSVQISGYAVLGGDDIVIRQFRHDIAEVTMPTAKALASGNVQLAQVPSTRDVCYFIVSQFMTQLPDSTVCINDNCIAVDQAGLFLEDDNAGDDIVLFKNRVPRYEDLPIGLYSPDGWPVIEVIGDSDAEYTYYVQPEGTVEAVLSPGALSYNNPETFASTTVTPDKTYHLSDIRWRETNSPEHSFSIDPATMPHILVQTAEGFELRYADWSERSAGDTDSNSAPKFVGNTIRDMGAYQNRLVFLSDRYVCASYTDDWFNFWKRTVVSEDPANPCFIAAGGTQSSNVTVQLDRLAVVAGELLVMTSDIQYKISGASEFTNSSPLIPVTSFALDTSVPVADSGNGILVASYTGRFTNIKELLVSGDSRLVYPVGLTDHCPYYITGRAKQILMHTSSNIGFVLADGLFVYEAAKNTAGQQIQNAWSKWTFGQDAEDVVKHIWLSANSLMMLVLAQVYSTVNEGIVKTPTYMVLSIPLELRDVEFLSFRPCLDRMQEVTTVTVGDYTSSLPSDIGNNIHAVLISDTPGVELEVVQIDNADPAVSETEDIPAGSSVVIGIPYTAECTLSPMYLRRQDGTPRTQGRTQLQRMWLDYSLAGYVKATVTDKAGRTSEVYWDSTEDSVNGIYDTITLQSGTLTVPLRGTNTDVTVKITSDNFKPFSCTSAQFSARYGKKRTARAKNRVQSI